MLIQLLGTTKFFWGQLKICHSLVPDPGLLEHFRCQSLAPVNFCKYTNRPSLTCTKSIVRKCSGGIMQTIPLMPVMEEEEEK